jgi:hypothetical protein
MLEYNRRANAIGATVYSWGRYAEYGNFISTSMYKKQDLVSLQVDQRFFLKVFMIFFCLKKYKYYKIKVT